MTLTTAIRIVEPVPVRPIFDYARRLIGAENAVWRERAADPRWEHDNPDFRNEAGQGYPALLWVEYGPDGPLRDYPHEDNCEDGRCTCPPAGSVEVNYDTAYGYHGGDNGFGLRNDPTAHCGDLHAWLVQEMGRYLASRGLTWYWHDESRGEWHRGAVNLERLGDPDKGALFAAV